MENFVEKTSCSLVDNLRPFLENYIKNHMKTIVKNQETEKENYEYMLNLPVVVELNKKIVMLKEELNVKNKEIEMLKSELSDAKDRMDLVIKEKNVINNEPLEEKQESIEKELKMKLMSTSLYNNDYMRLDVDDDESTDEDKYTDNSNKELMSVNIYKKLHLNSEDEDEDENEDEDEEDDEDEPDKSSEEEKEEEAQSEDDTAYDDLKESLTTEIKCVKVEQEPAEQIQAEEHTEVAEQAEQSEEQEEEQAEQSEEESEEEEQAEQSEEESEEEEELYDIIINGKTYCTDNDLEGNVWELIETDEGDDVGDFAGRHKNGKWVSHSN